MSLLQYLGQKANEAKARALAVPGNYREAYNSGKEVAIRVKKQLAAEGADVHQTELTFSFMRAGIHHEGLTIEARIGYSLGILDGRFTFDKPKR